MQSDWTTSTQPSAFAASAPVLRPLTTGELLDNTFTLYRSRFWLFAGMAALSGAWNAVLQMLQMLTRHMIQSHYGFLIARVGMQISSIIVALLLLPVLGIVYAATVYALGEVYLLRPVTAAMALRATSGRWLRYVGITLWQIWSAGWLFLALFVPVVVLIPRGVNGGVSPLVIGSASLLAVLLAFPYGVVAYIRNSLAVPAAVVENIGVRASIRRSKQLAAGTKGRIFLLFIVVLALYFVVGMIELPFGIIIARNPLAEHLMIQTAMLLVGFVAHMLLSPIFTIGLALAYFDQRVRKEAFDLQVLMGDEAIPGLTNGAATPGPGMLAAEPLLDPADTYGSDGRI
jgi:hypothetical protein